MAAVHTPFGCTYHGTAGSCLPSNVAPLGCMVTPCLNPVPQDTPALGWKVRVGPQGWLSWAAFKPLDPMYWPIGPLEHPLPFVG